MGSGTGHMLVNGLLFGALVLVAVRYSSEMSTLFGSAANSTVTVFNAASGLAPAGYSIPR